MTNLSEPTGWPNEGPSAEVKKLHKEIERLRQHIIDEGMKTTIQIINAEAEIERLRETIRELRRLAIHVSAAGDKP